MCEKVSYDTRDLAVKAINGISKNKKQAFRSYNCDECGKWHITSVKKNRLDRPKKDKKYREDYSNEINAAIEAAEKKDREKRKNILKSKKAQEKRTKARIDNQ